MHANGAHEGAGYAGDLGEAPAMGKGNLRLSRGPGGKGASRGKAPGTQRQSVLGTSNPAPPLAEWTRIRG